MNRIREIREKRGLTQVELADLVGTTQPTIMRLETGKRKLTVDWMQKIAKALHVRPEDLVANAILAGFSEEAEAYVSADQAMPTAALSARGLAYFVVKSDTVELAGVPAGTVILIDMTEAAVRALKTGDIVVAQAYDMQAMRAQTIVRQFVPPSLLVTNRKGSNIAFNIEDPTYDVAIKGVRVVER